MPSTATPATATRRPTPGAEHAAALRARDESPLGIARTAFELLVTGPAPLSLDARCYAGLPDRELRLDELRTRLLAPACPRATRDAVWAELVRRSRTGGPAWTIGCVGVALPALTTLAAQLCARFAGDRSDVHAEILRGFLTGLATIDVDRPSVMTRLRWHAYRAGHAAVREALDAPAPRGIGGHSAPPPVPAGHPDFVLARAVTAGAVTQAEADLIGVTRLEDVALRDWAGEHGLNYVAARQVRSRAERRLVAWIASEHTEPESGGGRQAPTAGRVSHIGPDRGVQRRGTTPLTPRPGGRTADAADVFKESRCA
ncbi:hypothetical protein [Jatrophihabitans lederbergiae]|uniref:Sigma-70 family RNA polymerase sigma factor n=1 Tax=Jatrophihabitans lederbergiae TaxID=3075547 RepID=A0ABU2JGM0_9ACTN|nr:hypothetical protein [Jatrophihabitans sp. DSM 44399]MDT0264119.1 hypothetical protein [Jatrophihabitans sp. DSM 44399]